MKQGQKRTAIQTVSSLVSNLYLAGFVKGRIYTGATKVICVPGLNCYSCPGAIGSCPLGALQSVIAYYKYQISFYATGTLMLFGIIAGRFICGYACPFGFFQDLLHKIPSRKITLSKKFSWLTHTRYFLLVLLVIVLPALLVNYFGEGNPWFCKVICPAGTLFGAYPLMLTNPRLFSAAGTLFIIKTTIAIAVVVACIFFWRFFCRFLCPLGAIYGLFNPISLMQYTCVKHECIRCGACKKKCGMGLDPVKDLKSPQCIRCGSCKSACNQGAIRFTVGLKDERKRLCRQPEILKQDK